MSLSCKACQKTTVTDNIDQPGCAAGEIVYILLCLVSKPNFINAGAGNFQTMIYVILELSFFQRLYVIADRNPLLQLN